MDDCTFDRLARLLAGRWPRRAALGTVLGAVLTAWPSATPDASAGIGRASFCDCYAKPCKRDNDCCGGTCAGTVVNPERRCGCSRAGGLCVADCGCCGSLVCRGGSCLAVA